MCETKSFILWFSQFLFLCGLLSLLLWVSLRAKTPTYTVMNLNLPTSATTENTIISFDIEIKNPNKDYSIYYDDIRIALLHGIDTIGQTTINAFHQDKKGTDTFSTSVDANGSAVLGEILNGKAELRVGLATKIRYRMLSRKSKHHGMELNGRVPIGKDGKISGKKKKIKLGKAKKK